MEAQYKLIFRPSSSTGGEMASLLGHGDFSWSYWGPLALGDDYDQSVKKLPKGQVLTLDGFCMFLSVLFDNGVLGFALYAAFFLALTINILRSLLRSHDPTMQALLIATFLPLVALLVCYQFSYDPLFLVLWIMLGFHLAAVYHADRLAIDLGEIEIPEPA